MRRVLNVRRHVHYANLERQTDRFHVSSGSERRSQ